jgi:hypothetical protein
VTTEDQDAHITQTLETCLNLAREANVFDEMTIQSDSSDKRLVAMARGAAAEALYSLEYLDGKWHVLMLTKDRWLSESIEAEVMHHGDSLEELIEEELIDLGLDKVEVKMQHYRDDEFRYVFKSPIGSNVTDTEIATWLLGYEAAFKQLGDMTEDQED